MRESGRGSGVEVTERGHDDDRKRVEGVISPAARSQHDRGSNLHRRCRTGGVSSPRVSIYTPSHTSTYSPVSAKSLHINQIQTHHPTPRCRKLVQGGGRGATPRKTGVLRTRQVFLRHTCRVGSLPSKLSFQEGEPHLRRSRSPALQDRLLNSSSTASVPSGSPTAGSRLSTGATGTAMVHGADGERAVRRRRRAVRHFSLFARLTRAGGPGLEVGRGIESASGSPFGLTPALQ